MGEGGHHGPSGKNPINLSPSGNPKMNCHSMAFAQALSRPPKCLVVLLCWIILYVPPYPSFPLLHNGVRSGIKGNEE